VERCFADVSEVWHRRSSERAEPTVLGLFPHGADTVAAREFDQLGRNAMPTREQAQRFLNRSSLLDFELGNSRPCASN
jgi:hypothetical protein